jgi:hypothetical protein
MSGNLASANFTKVLVLKSIVTEVELIDIGQKNSYFYAANLYSCKWIIKIAFASLFYQTAPVEKISSFVAAIFEPDRYRIIF